MANRNWRGTISSAWGLAGNWLEGAVPTANDDALFSSAGNNPCTVDIATAVCLGLAVAAGYTANFDLNGNTLQVGENGVALDAGMGFIHNNGKIELRSTHATLPSQLTSAGKTLYDVWVNPVNNTGAIINDALTARYLDVDKGTCNISNRTVTLNGLGSGGVDVAAGATLNMINATVICNNCDFINAGTLTTTGSSLTMGNNNYNCVLTTGGQALNDLTIDKSPYFCDASAGTVTINGKFTLQSVGNGWYGTFDCKGDIDSAQTYKNAWTGKVLVSGSGTQTITDTAGGGGGALCDFEINKSGGSVTFATDMAFGGGNGGGDISFKYTAGTVIFTAGITLRFHGQDQLWDVGALTLDCNVEVDTDWNQTIVGGGTVLITGNLTVTKAGAWDGPGTWEVRGNIITADISAGADQTGLWKMTGTEDQILSGSGEGHAPYVEVNKTGGSWAMAGTVTISGGSGTKLKLTTPGYCSFGTSKLILGQRHCTLDLGGVPLHDLELEQGIWDFTAGPATVVVGGKLTIVTVDSIFQNLEVKGDIESQDADVNGSGTITLTGTGDQNINVGTNQLPDGNLIINKPSGAAILVAALTLDVTGQDLVIAQGILRTAGYALDVDDILDIDGTLEWEGDEITAGTVEVDTSQSTITYTGSPDVVIDDLATAFFNLTLGASKTHKLSATIIVAGKLDSDGLTASRSVLETTTPGTRKKLTLNGYSTLADKVDATDIDSGDGIEVLAPGSLISNCVNWNVATGPAENPVGSGVVRRPGGRGLVKGVLEWT